IVGQVNDDRFGPTHGFLLSGGSYTKFDVGTFTSAFGINASGQIVGFYERIGVSGAAGFILSSGSSITLKAPSTGANGSTYAFGINASGQIAGAYTDGSGVGHGFLYSGGA